MELLQAIAARKSVRSYLRRRVEDEKINAVVQAGNMAPTVTQLHILVITNEDVLALICDRARQRLLDSGVRLLAERAAAPEFNAIYGAPAIVVLSARKAANQLVYNNNVASAACAAQNMMLEATEAGLGSCYLYAPALAFSDAEMRRRVGMDAEDEALCTVLLGYTSDAAPHAPRVPATNVRYCT